MRAASRRTGGFTMVELMVAVGILVAVTGAVMQTFVVQNKAYTVVDQTIEAQQNLRAISSLMERDARMSGFMVPEAAALCGIDRDDAPDTLWVTDADAIDPTDQVRPSLGAEVTGGYTSAAAGIKTLVVDSSVLDGAPFYDTDADGAPDADFQANGGAILVDADDPAAGAACGRVLDVGPNFVRVDFDEAGIAPPPVNHRVVLVPAHLYEVVVPAGAGDPTLVRNGQLLATDVEDFQVAYFFDLNRDGDVDGAGAPGGEEPGGAGGDAYDPTLWDHRDLREVRLNLVVRTRDDDVENDQGFFQATENRAAAAASDGFRRRVHQSTVRLRNVGFRGVSS